MGDNVSMPLQGQWPCAEDRHYSWRMSATVLWGRGKLPDCLLDHKSDQTPRRSCRPFSSIFQPTWSQQHRGSHSGWRLVRVVPRPTALQGVVSLSGSDTLHTFCFI